MEGWVGKEKGYEVRKEKKGRGERDREIEIDIIVLQYIYRCSHFSRVVPSHQMMMKYLHAAILL